MGIRVRIEIGDRLVEVNAETREDALKAFKFAARGQFAPASVHVHLRWAVGLQKIAAIKALREITSLDLRDAKAIVETGSYRVPAGHEAAVRQALAPYVTFIDPA